MYGAAIASDQSHSAAFSGALGRELQALPLVGFVRKAPRLQQARPWGTPPHPTPDMSRLDRERFLLTTTAGLS
jgi:hypothetical protein